MSSIIVQGNQVGLFYQSGTVSSFQPVYNFEIEEYETGYKLKIKTVYYAWVNKGKEWVYPTSWSKHYGVEYVNKAACALLVDEVKNKLAYLWE